MLKENICKTKEGKFRQVPTLTILIGKTCVLLNLVQKFIEI